MTSQWSGNSKTIGYGADVVCEGTIECQNWLQQRRYFSLGHLRSRNSIQINFRYVSDKLMNSRRTSEELNFNYLIKNQDISVGISSLFTNNDDSKERIRMNMKKNCW